MLHIHRLQKMMMMRRSVVLQEVWILLSVSVLFSAVHSLMVPQRQPAETIVGQCRIVPASKEELYPPCVLIGGMAQTWKSWEHHLPNLSKNRQVIIYECLGQGTAAITTTARSGISSSNNTISNNLLLANVSLPFQAEQLLQTLDDLSSTLTLATPDHQQIFDLVGFSFGARVAMATVCLQQQQSGRRLSIRKLHLTGVATDRSDYGHLATESWKDAIRKDDSLRCFAWSVLLATYSPSFLLRSSSSSSLSSSSQTQQPNKIEGYLNHICQTNSPQGLLALLEQADISDPRDPWHVVNMADRIMMMNQKNLIIRGRLCVGELDQMAPVQHAQELCQRLGWADPTVIPNCGHAVALEAARAWRDNVLSFLNDDD
jgi:pimeloyl-ACP methyl ester carboxylesterase